MRGAVQSLPVLIGASDHLLEQLLALVGVVDGLELIAESELDRALETHTPELSGRPRDREEGRLRAAARHCLAAEAVHLAQDDREERHAEIGAGDEHSAAV